MGRIGRILLVLALVVVVGGCGGLPVKPSGFLSHYDRLRPDEEIDGLWWWEASGVDWSKYHKVCIEPIDVRINLSKTPRRISPDEIRRLSLGLRKAIVNALKDRYPIVERPGPGVLVLKAALVHLKPVSRKLNIVTSMILMWPIDTGEAAVEAQFLDGASGKLLGEVLMSSEGSTLEITKVWSRWEQVEEAFKQWAKLLRKAMDEATSQGR